MRNVDLGLVLCEAAHLLEVGRDRAVAESDVPMENLLAIALGKLSVVFEGLCLGGQGGTHADS